MSSSLLDSTRSASLCLSVCHRYRAVASWSRVQGVGIPLLTAIEIVCVWILSVILAVPEAIGFDMVSFTYRNKTIRTCMLNPKTDFMLVCYHPFLVFLDKGFAVEQCFACSQAKMCCTVRCVKALMLRNCWVLQKKKKKKLDKTLSDAEIGNPPAVGLLKVTLRVHVSIT